MEDEWMKKNGISIKGYYLNILLHVPRSMHLETINLNGKKRQHKRIFFHKKFSMRDKSTEKMKAVVARRWSRSVWREQGVTAVTVTFCWGDKKIFWNQGSIHSQLCEYIKNHWIIPFFFFLKGDCHVFYISIKLLF